MIVTDQIKRIRLKEDPCPYCLAQIVVTAKGEFCADGHDLIDIESWYPGTQKRIQAARKWLCNA